MIGSEEGYSLVESLIAMAILLSVLVPAAIFLTYIGNNIYAKDKITSYNFARNEMEYILATQNDSTKTKLVDENWWVKTTVQNDEALFNIKVEVFKKDTLTPPKITLETARLWYKED